MLTIARVDLVIWGHPIEIRICWVKQNSSTQFISKFKLD